MKNSIGKIETDRRGRLNVDGISVDKNAKINTRHGDVVEYFVRTINPRHGGASFQVAVPTRKFSEEELLEQTPILHTFEKVEIRRFKFEGGKAVIQSADSENRWTGEKLPVHDRRQSSADIATVTVRGATKQEFGETVEVVTAVILDSWKNQEDEPDYVFDLLGWRSNTKSRMYYPNLSKAAWHWRSVSGHANIHHFTAAVVVPFGETITDEYHSEVVYGSYQRETFQSFEASCVSLLSSKGSTERNWIRADGDHAWVAWSWYLDHRRRIEIIPNPSQKSGNIIYVWDDTTFWTRHIFEYEFKRLSHFVRLICERVGKQVLGGKEEEIKKSDISSIVDKGTGVEHFSPEDRLILSKKEELEAAGYSIGISTMEYSGYTSISRWIEKDGQSLGGFRLRPIVHGFAPDIQPEQMKTFAQAVEILAGGKELVISLNTEK